MTIQHAPGERLVIVVFGASAPLNLKLMRAGVRMGSFRLVVVGEPADFIEAQYVAAGLAVELHPPGTVVPSGEGVIVLGEQGVAELASRGDKPLNS